MPLVIVAWASRPGPRTVHALAALWYGDSMPSLRLFARSSPGISSRPLSSKMVALAAALFALSGSACSGPGQFVWFSELPKDGKQSTDFVIGEGDVVSIRVLGHEDMTVREKVRPDGRIALPIIGEVDTRGKQPVALRAELETRLKDYIVSPSVMVNVEEQEALTVVVMGEVSKPGAYPLPPSAGLAEALAVSGGLTDYASRDSIYVMRQRPAPLRIRFTWEWVSRDTAHAARFPLRPGDVVVVE
jgi:polysaccharide export outer membrane protein